MALKPNSRQPIGKQPVTPRRKGLKPVPAAVPPASQAPQETDSPAKGSKPPAAPKSRS